VIPVRTQFNSNKGNDSLTACTAHWDYYTHTDRMWFSWAPTLRSRYVNQTYLPCGSRTHDLPASPHLAHTISRCYTGTLNPHAQNKQTIYILGVSMQQPHYHIRAYMGMDNTSKPVIDTHIMLRHSHCQFNCKNNEAHRTLIHPYWQWTCNNPCMDYFNPRATHTPSGIIHAHCQ